MSRRELLLLILLVILSGVVPLLLVFYNWDTIDQIAQRAAPTVPVVPPPEPREQQVVEIDTEDASPPDWKPLERLDYALGPWRTEDGVVRLTLASRRSPEGEGGMFWLQPFRLTLETDGRPALVCGLYEALTAEEDEVAWRRGYCQSADQPGPAVVTRVYLLRRDGLDGLRLVVGSDIDIEVQQAP